MIESLQEKLKQKETESMISDDKDCGICFETLGNRPMVFFPCGHAKFCQSCYGHLPNPKKCPECRVKIQKAAVLFL